MKDYYQIFGVNRNSTQDEIKNETVENWYLILEKS